MVLASYLSTFFHLVFIFNRHYPIRGSFILRNLHTKMLNNDYLICKGHKSMGRNRSDFEDVGNLKSK